MKRELAAAAALVLVCCAAAWHTLFVIRTADELCGMVAEAERAYSDGDADGAAERLHEALELWLDDGYLAAALRHSELDSVTQGFFDQLELIAERSPSCSVGFERLTELISGSAKSELPSPGSIF